MWCWWVFNAFHPKLENTIGFALSACLPVSFKLLGKTVEEDIVWSGVRDRKRGAKQFNVGERLRVGVAVREGS